MTKVLLIRFSSIGDIVLTTPVIRNLKQQMHGGVEIHYLTKQQFRSIIDPNPHVDKVYTIEKSTNEVIEALKAEDYDYVIDLHRNLRSARVKSALKVLDFTFEKYNWQKWLLVNFGIDRMPKLHIVDRYMATITRFGIENDGRGLEFFLPENGLPSLHDLPESHHAGYIAVPIGAAHWRKRLRASQVIELCKRLSYPVVLLGGPDDKAMGDEIAAAGGASAWNAAGAFNLQGSAWLVKHSLLVITPDTGLMHIAAAFKKPIISIWAATVPEFGMYPYLNEALDIRVQADHLGKRPCSKLGTRCKYKECRCVDELPLSRISDEARKALGQVPKTRSESL